MQLCELGVDLEQQDDAAGFLGVTLERDPETYLLEMKQTGLIKQVIEALSLDNGLVKGKYTPSESKSLIKDLNGEPASGAFCYISVVGMIQYLSGHTRPDIAFSVNCCLCSIHVQPQTSTRVSFEMPRTLSKANI